MPRLIDADEVAKDIAWLNEYDFVIWHNVMECIDKQPTVDAVEVVRCKDCKFFRRYGFRLEYAECINFDFYDTTEDGYCAWGERKEKMSKNDNSTYLCNEYQDLIEIRRWCAIFGAVQLISLVLLAIACVL